MTTHTKTPTTTAFIECTFPYACKCDHCVTGNRRKGCQAPWNCDCPACKVAAPDPVAWDRAETDPCQKGTEGCCINHDVQRDGCETW